MVAPRAGDRARALAGRFITGEECLPQRITLADFFEAMTQDGFVDWEWLRSKPVVEEKRFVRHIRLSKAITTKINGHQNKGIILKPE